MSDQEIAFQMSTSEVVGSSVGTAIDGHIGLVRGYKAARDPELVTARKEMNDARILQIKAQLLGNLA